MVSPPAGYSGTPLAKKLGYKAGARAWLHEAPAGYLQWLSPLPAAVGFEKQPGPSVGLAHIFVTEREDLEQQLKDLREVLGPEAMLWVSWPKKASKVPSTVTEDTIRELALPLGFVDVKVCGVSDVWSGLKLVLRREFR